MFHIANIHHNAKARQLTEADSKSSGLKMAGRMKPSARPIFTDFRVGFHLCVDVCAYACMYMHVCVRLRVYVHVCVCVRVYVRPIFTVFRVGFHLCVYLCIHARTHARTQSIHEAGCVPMFCIHDGHGVDLHTCRGTMLVKTHIYIQAYTYIYIIYIHTQTDTHTERERGREIVSR